MNTTKKKVCHVDLETDVHISVLSHTGFVILGKSFSFPKHQLIFFKWSIHCLGVGGEQLRLFKSECQFVLQKGLQNIFCLKLGVAIVFLEKLHIVILG